MHYDKIFVLDDGKLVEEGSPRDLLFGDGIFREMVGDKFAELKQTLETLEVMN